MGFRWARSEELEELLKTTIVGPFEEIQIGISGYRQQQVRQELQQMEAFAKAAGYHIGEVKRDERYLKLYFYKFIDPKDAESDDLTKQL